VLLDTSTSIFVMAASALGWVLRQGDCCPCHHSDVSSSTFPTARSGVPKPVYTPGLKSPALSAFPHSHCSLSLHFPPQGHLAYSFQLGVLRSGKRGTHPCCHFSHCPLWTVANDYSQLCWLNMTPDSPGTLGPISNQLPGPIHPHFCIFIHQQVPLSIPLSPPCISTIPPRELEVHSSFNSH
jgi:hypothetical protein